MQEAKEVRHGSQGLDVLPAHSDLLGQLVLSAYPLPLNSFSIKFPLPEVLISRGSSYQ